jgi:hypothetical protein
MRALANESARRAIGVHATRTHRRDAVTKFIMASMAGITSLWLILLAPSCRDLEFIAACVSLGVALVWATQTYRKLLEMAHAGDYDRPEDDLDEDAPGRVRLPIDIDNESRSRTQS